MLVREEGLISREGKEGESVGMGVRRCRALKDMECKEPFPIAAVFPREG